MFPLGQSGSVVGRFGAFVDLLTGDSMTTQTMSGERAFAHGAVAAGVKVVAGYPGSPSSGVFDAIAALTAPEDVHLEWSANEKVALEVAMGASLAGRRALVCVKSVGMNVLVDPLMVINLTGVHGGLVILLGDDPGAYGSQNDQDTRPIAELSELPLWEPATPSEALEMMQEAFAVSERYRTVVIVRETRSFAQRTESVEVDDAPPQQVDRGLARVPFQWVPYPGNAVEKHRELHAKLEELRVWSNHSRFQQATGSGSQGIVGCGFAHSKLIDVLGPRAAEVRLLKLGVLNPLPDDVLGDFLLGCDEVLVLEENDPFVEWRLRALAQKQGCNTRIRGRQTDDVPWAGELYRWQIQDSLASFLGGERTSSYREDGEALERPLRKDNCAGCPALRIVEVLREAAAELKQDPYLIGDPGCLVKASQFLDAKFCMGSAIAVAHGLLRAGVEERVVAIFGDSAFFHTAIPALINSTHNETAPLLLVLDNSATVTSGNQANPGTGRDARGADAPRLSIEEVAAVCGARQVLTVGPDDNEDVLRDAFRTALVWRELGLVVVRKPCKKV
jgi:indolepyruvate ferredoxin oxidoreductase alpha subunit